MNVVLDQAAEVSVKGESRTDLGTLPSDVDMLHLHGLCGLGLTLLLSFSTCIIANGPSATRTSSHSMQAESFSRATTSRSYNPLAHDDDKPFY